MNNKLFLLPIIALAMIQIYCGGGQVQDIDPKVSANRAWADNANNQLAEVPVEGFAYKGSAVPKQNWDKWAKAAAPVVKGIINQMPEGYVFQVTGHTDAKGPEQPEGNKPGNIKISTDRAKAVQASLQKQGITSPKMTAKGVGSSEPLRGEDPTSSKQRRVTFKVVPQ